MVAETTVPRRQALRRIEVFLLGFVMMVQAEVREQGVLRMQGILRQSG
jgi:hypothetical protein